MCSVQGSPTTLVFAEFLHTLNLLSTSLPFALLYHATHNSLPIRMSYIRQPQLGILPCKVLGQAYIPLCETFDLRFLTAFGIPNLYFA